MSQEAQSSSIAGLPRVRSTVAPARLLRAQSAGSMHRMLRAPSAGSRHKELDSADSGEQIVHVRAVARGIRRSWMALMQPSSGTRSSVRVSSNAGSSAASRSTGGTACSSGSVSQVETRAVSWWVSQK